MTHFTRAEKIHIFIEALGHVFDGAAEEWHELPGEAGELHAHLGLTIDEYSALVLLTARIDAGESPTLGALLTDRLDGATAERLLRDRQICDLRAAGMTLEDTARAAGCSIPVVYKVARAAGVRPGSNWYRHDARVLKLYRLGVPQVEIAREIGVGKNRITKILNRLLPDRPDGRRNSGRRPKRQTPAQIAARQVSAVNPAEALKMRAQGQTLRQIGKHFGVSAERVRQILSREAAP